MKKYWKRAIAIMCAVTMIAGIVWIDKNSPNVAKASADYVDIFPCESLEGIDHYKTITQTLDKTTFPDLVKEGNWSYQQNRVDQVRLQLSYESKSIDISEYRDGYLSFWFYIGDISKIKPNGIVVEIASQQQANDKNELQWVLAKQADWKTGWNEIKLNFEDGDETDGEIDYHNIKRFRIYLQDGETGTTEADKLETIIDGIKAVKKPKPVVEEVHTVLNETEASNIEWTMAKDTDDYLFVKKDVGLNLDYAKQINSYEEYLMLYVVVDIDSTANLDRWRKTRFELANATNDQKELQWEIEGRKSSVGTNYLYFKFSDGNVSNEKNDHMDPIGINYRETINYFRMYNSDEENLKSTPFTGIKIKEVKVIRWLPWVKVYDDAVAGVEPADTPAGYTFAGWYENEKCIYSYASKTPGTAYAKFVHGASTSAAVEGHSLEELQSVGIESVLNVYSQQGHVEAAGMIADCDRLPQTGAKVGLTSATAGEGNELTIADDAKEGTGAYQTTGMAKDRLQLTLDNTVDVSKYGRLHFWLHVDDPTKLIDSSATADHNDILLVLGDSNGLEKTFTLPAPRIVEWNEQTKNYEWQELELNFKDAVLSTDNGTETVEETTVTDLFNYAKIATFELKLERNTETDIVITIDDIRAVYALPGEVISDCDTTTGITGVENDLHNAKPTQDSKYVKDGIGAAYCDVPNESGVRFHYALEQSVDITKYSDGKLSLWVYIENVEELFKGIIDPGHQNLRVEIGSSNEIDTEELEFVAGKNTLQDGWNHLEFNLCDGSRNEVVDDTQGDTTVDTQAETSDGAQEDDVTVSPINYTQIRRVRIYTPYNTNEVVMAHDDVRIIPEKQMLGSVYTHVKENDVVQIRHDIKLDTGAENDISKYSGTVTGSKKDRLYLRFYISDVTAIGDMGIGVEISSDGNYNIDKHALEWQVPKSELKKGWNELEFFINNAQIDTGKRQEDEGINLAAVNQFRVYLVDGAANEAITTKVEDVKVISADVPQKEVVKRSAAIRFMTTVDSAHYQNVGFDITINGKTNTITSKKVYQRMYGFDGTAWLTYVASEAFDLQSNYFKMYVIRNIPDSAFDTPITVTPYWTTKDGTKVYGVTKEYTIYDLIDGNGGNIVGRQE